VNYFAPVGEGAEEFDSDFEANGAVPVESDVAACLGLLRANCVPDLAAEFGYEARELGLACLALDDGQGDAFELLELNGAGGHSDHP
jgi:hypothetical protein